MSEPEGTRGEGTAPAVNDEAAATDLALAHLEKKMGRFPLTKKASLLIQDMKALDWLTQFELGVMHNDEKKKKVDFKAWWKETVPMAYTLEENQDCLAPFSNCKPMVEGILIEPMVLFLTGGEGSVGFFEVSH